ncbi:MAG: glycerol-3-phosphate acyltransferase [Candidatus Nanopelagicales bacterium]
MKPKWQELVAAAAGSYAFGSLSPADLAARMGGVDLSQVGSGNPGATNVTRALGTKTGVAVGAADIVKGFVPAWYFSRYGAPAGQVAGLSAVLGHITSPLLKGRGGKGVATSLGAILAVDPTWSIPAVGTFAAAFSVTRRVGISSVAGTFLLVPVSLVARRDGEDWWDVGFAGGLALVVIYRHRRNIASFRREWTERRASAPVGPTPQDADHEQSETG